VRKYLVTIADDDGPTVVLHESRDRHLAQTVFDMLVKMVTAPGNKREGDAVDLRITTRFTTVARYHREATR